MKTSKQDIQDLLAAIANDVEDIKAMLNSNGGAVGTTSADVVADTGMSGKRNAISNDAAVGNGLTTANADRIIAEINRFLEPIAQTCCKLPGRLKSYYAQLLLRIPKDLREELNRDNNTRKCKGLPTVEDKIDNSTAMLIYIYDRLNQLEDAILYDTPPKGQSARGQGSPEMSARGKGSRATFSHEKTAKSGIIAQLQSAWSWMRQFHSKRPMGRYRNPYILCAIGICLLYFALSIFSWSQWHHYRDENTRLRLAADKYYVDSVIIREIYPQAAITLSAYEHITETEGADAALHAFRNKVQELDSKHKSKSKQNHNE